MLLDKYFVDELYAGAIVRPLVWISTNFLWHVVDEGVIDGPVNGVAREAREAGATLRDFIPAMRAATRPGSIGASCR